MVHDGFTVQQRVVGRAAAWAVFVFGVVYAVITTLGFLLIGIVFGNAGKPQEA